jgi:hypothetical protein
MKHIIIILLLSFFTSFVAAQSLAEITGENVSLHNALAKVKGIDPLTYTTKQFRLDAAAYAKSIGMEYWYSPANGWNNIAILHAQPTNKVDSIRRPAPIFFPSDRDGGKVGIMGNGSYVIYGKAAIDSLDLDVVGNVHNPEEAEVFSQAQIDSMATVIDSIVHRLDSVRNFQKRMIDSLRNLHLHGQLDWHMDRAEFNCNCELDNGLDALNTRWMDLRTLARFLGKKHPLYATVNDCVQESKRAAHRAWGMENAEKRTGKQRVDAPVSKPYDAAFGPTTVSMKLSKPSKGSKKPSYGGISGKGKRSGKKGRNVWNRLWACKKASKV